MTSPNNCHGLFTHPVEQSLLSGLKLSDIDKTHLQTTRADIKKVIREGFEAHRAAMKERRFDYELPSPRFYTQGSFAYRTINAPAYPPKQQVDLDLGIYLPFEHLLENKSPKQSAKTYFDLIESILTACGKWGFKTKDTCIRILLNDRLHIDLPLYGIPAAEFQQVVEAINQRRIQKSVQTFDAAPRLDPTCVHLAMKNGDWKPSDPRSIKDWVDATCAAHGDGNQVRAVARYLKAWRDEQWKDGGGPSSIFLLACTIHNYDHVNGHHHNLLRAVVTSLPGCLDRPVLVPAPIPDNKEHHEDLRVRISEEKRHEFKQAFSEFNQQYEVAMTTVNSLDANSILRKIFGPRLPHDPSRIVRVTPPSPGSKVTSTTAKVAPLAMGSQSAGG